MKPKKPESKKHLKISRGVLLLAAASAGASAHGQNPSTNLNPEEVMELILQVSDQDGVRNLDSLRDVLRNHEVVFEVEAPLNPEVLHEVPVVRLDVKGDAIRLEQVQNDPLFEQLRQLGVLKVEVSGKDSSCDRLCGCRTGG